jgi:periplasmic protein TonB
MRVPGWILPAGGIALCVNGALLGMGLFLSHEKIEQKQDIESVTRLNYLPEMTQEEVEQDQQVAEPEQPKEEPQPDMAPDLFEADIAPELAAIGAAAGEGVSINLGGATQGLSSEKFVFETYELDQAPRPVVKTPPVYPYKAREQHIEGVVQIKILVREDGSVGEVLILDSRPKDVFDDAVLASVPRWRFEPGKVSGKAVTAWVVTALHFKLNS